MTCLSVTIATREYSFEPGRKIAVLFGSPKPDGHTARLLELFLQQASGCPIDRIDAYSHHIKPCVDCGYCTAHSGCPRNGDGYGALLDRLQSADMLVVATPVYFASVPAPLKAIFDRAQQLFFKSNPSQKNKHFAKHGVVITSCGADNTKMADCVAEQCRWFFSCLQTGLSTQIHMRGSDKIPLSGQNSSDIAWLSRKIFAERPHTGVPQAADAARESES